MPKSAPFAIAIEDPSIIDVQFTSTWVELAARAPARGQLVDTQIVRAHGAVIARGAMKNWAGDEAGVSIIFFANWLSHRAGTPLFGGESCYLSMPALTGPDATTFADSVFGEGNRINSRSDIATATRLGAVYSSVFGNNASLGRNLVYPSDRTEGDVSVPKPSFDAAAGTVWGCVDNPDVLRVNSSNSKAFVAALAAQAAHNSLSALAGAGGGSECSGIAVVSDGAFQTAHDVTLLVIDGGHGKLPVGGH